MLSPLRAQVNACLERINASRKPALRRTENPAFLLMTDLPRIADDAAVEAFVAMVEALGWQVQAAPGWLMLDHPVEPPALCWPEEMRGEWGCCVQLLRLHRDHAPAQGYIRALVKAADVGSDRVEQLCRHWHGEFAALLREHRPLPGELAPYLCAAMKEDAK